MDAAISQIENKEMKKMLNQYLTEIEVLFGDNLVASYIYGSVTFGDFTEKISDIDFLTVLKSSANLYHSISLERIHALLSLKNKYAGYLEGEYVSINDIGSSGVNGQTIRYSEGRAMFIDKSEIDSVILFYIYNKGIHLYGPLPKEIIPKISSRSLNQLLIQYIKEMLPETESKYPDKTGNYWEHYLSSDILALCRAWYMIEKYQTISKTGAGLWAIKRIGENYRAAIRSALAFRNNTANQRDKRNMLEGKIPLGRAILSRVSI